MLVNRRKFSLTPILALDESPYGSPFIMLVLTCSGAHPRNSGATHPASERPTSNSRATLAAGLPRSRARSPYAPCAMIKLDIATK
jgi:hypothetical protein